MSGPGPGGHGDSVRQQQRVIVVNADNNNQPSSGSRGRGPVPGDKRPAPSDTDSPEGFDFTIGVPKPNFAIKDSVLYSHNYYKKVTVEEEGKSFKKAQCLMCLVDRNEHNTLRITDNNIKGTD